MINEAEYLEALVKPLVSQPEQVKVERTQDERGVLLTLHVAQEDIAHMIGKQGQTAQSIRMLLRLYGVRNRMLLAMKIFEPNKMAQPVAHSVHKPSSQLDDFEL